MAVADSLEIKMKPLLFLLLTLPAYATNLQDFAMFSKHWLVQDCGWCRGYDYSGDGDVDVVDLAIFAERWLEVSNPSKIKISGTLNPDIEGIELPYLGDELGFPVYGQNVDFSTFLFNGYPGYIFYYDGERFLLEYATDESTAYAWENETESLSFPIDLTPRDGTEYEPDINTPTGTATIQTGDSMASFNYYRNLTGAEKCFRIINFNTGQVWDTTANDSAGGMADYTSVDGADYDHGNIASSFVAGMPGHVITIPSNLPAGDYDIIMFNAAAASATYADSEEVGFGFKWTGNSIQKLKEYLVDKIA